MTLGIDLMLSADWPAVRVVYLEGIATGQATFETDATLSIWLAIARVIRLPIAMFNRPILRTVSNRATLRTVRGLAGRRNRPGIIRCPIE